MPWRFKKNAILRVATEEKSWYLSGFTRWASGLNTMGDSRAEVLQSLKLRLQQISKAKSPVATRPVRDMFSREGYGLVRENSLIGGNGLVPEAHEAGVVSLGVAALDELLPQRGVPAGGMMEWLMGGAGVGAATLALAGVRAALKKPGYWVVIDPRRQFFPPAAWGWGISADRLLLVHPESEQDAAWAFEQALRCPSVAVAWNWIDSVSERMLQRWKIAAESGRGQGVLFRSDRALKQAAWADVRWLVRPVAVRRGERSGAFPVTETSRRLSLRLIYCRGALGEKQVEVECHDKTGVVRVVPPVADTTSHRAAAGA